MTVYDRGTKKWVSLILPEHVEQLKEAFIEYKEKPRLDEQRMMEIDLKLKEALKNHGEIEITYYQDRDFKTRQGKLIRIDALRGCVYLIHGNRWKIPLRDIIDVTRICNEF